MKDDKNRKIGNREKERKRERETRTLFGSLRSTAVDNIIYKYLYTYIFSYIYTISVRACLVRPMPNYHILILGLNGGLLVKHKKNTTLLTSDWHIMLRFLFLLLLFFFLNGRMSEATPFVGFASHRSIVLDPTFDSTFESNDLLYGIIEREHSSLIYEFSCFESSDTLLRKGICVR